jgi:periplasmic protein TonB
MNSEPMTATRTRNLTYSALFTLILVTGVAWWGEQTHFRAIFHPLQKDPTTVVISMPPDPVDPVEDADSHAKEKVDVARPEIEDSPVKPTITDIVIPIEPPHPEVHVRMDRIPMDGGGNGRGVHPFSLSQLDQGPEAKFRYRPIYPESMKRVGISGEVMVDFIVDPEGNVRNATAVSSNHREFEESACNAVSKWKFRPGKKDGRAVFVHMQVPIVFTLSDE